MRSGEAPLGVRSPDENRLQIPDQILGNVAKGVQVLPGLYEVQNGITRIEAINQTEEGKIITKQIKMKATLCKPILAQTQVVKDMLMGTTSRGT